MPKTQLIGCAFILFEVCKIMRRRYGHGVEVTSHKSPMGLSLVRMGGFLSVFEF